MTQTATEALTALRQEVERLTSFLADSEVPDSVIDTIRRASNDLYGAGLYVGSLR